MLYEWLEQRVHERMYILYRYELTEFIVTWRNSFTSPSLLSLAPHSSLPTPHFPFPISLSSLPIPHFPFPTSHFPLLTPHSSLLISHLPFLISHFSSPHFSSPTSCSPFLIPPILILRFIAAVLYEMLSPQLWTV